ncbi:hypothetical protein ACFP56_18400 [Paenibacillus septentrionalis]|uniref:Uncharacterized protein n=1 Tax=Paenibacillus septentrionalis TaxID=429342 RepID=A0ABW1V7G2_9BACL
MKKLVVGVIVLLLLSACGGGETGSNSGPIQQPNGAQQPKNQAGFSDDQLVPSTTTSEGDFALKLVTNKLRYQVDEQLQVYAELVYNGEQEVKEIGHAMYPVGFNLIEHTRDVELQGVMEEPYVVTPLYREEPVRYDYSVSGGLSGQEDADKKAFAKALMEGQLPEGRYTITARASFVINGSDPIEQYNMNTAIHFVVE